MIVDFKWSVDVSVRAVGLRNLVLMGILCCLCIGCGPKTQRTIPAGQSLRANLVFFYYEDLARAQEFYENTLGLERVLDYGFATIHRITPTSYLGLVDEKEGMHRASEPKTVTLAFVTEEVDAWYAYLKSQGVSLRGPAGDATRHPTRGFVAYDPEGYYLEFETFLDHPQNSKLREQLAQTEPLYTPAGMESSRPKNLGVQANVIWLYYEDIPAAQRFYEETFGFLHLVDQGFAKVYSSTPTCFIGLVDGAQGLHSFTEEKAVTISFLTPDVDRWYAYLQNQGLRFRGPVSDSEREPIRAFVAFDLAGYFLEFDWFYENPKNEAILRMLQK